MRGVVFPVLSRLGKAFLVVLGVVVVNFFLIRLAPGDPAMVLAGDAGSGDAAYVAHLRDALGLSRPLAEQFFVYLRNLAHLDFGYSYRSQEPVLTLVLERLPATLLLMAAAFAVSLAGGVAAGLIAAYGETRDNRWQRWLSRGISAGSLLIYATPLFWLSLMLLIVFSVVLGWLPSFGMETVAAGYTGWRHLVDVTAHLALPALSLGAVYGTVYVQLTRAAVLDVIGLEFVKTARAKGVPERRVLFAHVLRNALLPVISFGGIQLGQLAGGALITETVFAWPGLGSLMFDSLLQRDYPVLLGILIVVSALVVVLNVLTDLLYRLADPRIAAGVAA
jgi:peptide/nickel transport system permease protein